MRGIGGRASGRGITFISENMRIGAGEGGDYARAIPKARSAFVNRIGKIPFLRGLTIFTQPGMLIALALLIVNDVLSLLGIDTDFGISDTYLIIALALVIVTIWIIQRARGGSLKALRRYHAAEHMAINAYESGKPVTFESVSNALRIHARCGTNLVIIFFILSIPVLCFLPYGFCLIAVLCISYEIFLALPKCKFLKPLFKVCLWAQYHITTAQPGEKEIEAAVRGITRLTQS